jgi:ubiquinone/menaquinone biosynthesis C-methylase UbiE
LIALFVHRRRQLRYALRNQILDTISWRGDEKVLDVGCGSGVLLNGAALRVQNGKATGIDIWAPHGGGGNLNLLMKNARAEKVADRIEFKEMDARKMSFEDTTFDVVLSSGAMHHISHNREEFGQVVQEMTRVLKPGGQIVIWDIEHMVEACASRMTQAGLQCEVRKVDKFLNYEMGIMFGKKAG